LESTDWRFLFKYKEAGMRRKPSMGLFLAAALISFFVALPGSAGVTVNAATPFQQTVSIPCADGGAGEDVLLSGFLHVLVTETVDASGSLHTTTHFQPMGVAGTGLTTGDVYRATGITRDEANGLDVPFEATFVNNFRIIGPGKGNNVLVHEVFHVTVDALGEVTVLLDSVSVECK
jgi:hypothetical protein